MQHQQGLGPEGHLHTASYVRMIWKHMYGFLVKGGTYLTFLQGKHLSLLHMFCGNVFQFNKQVLTSVCVVTWLRGRAVPFNGNSLARFRGTCRSQRVPVPAPLATASPGHTRSVPAPAEPIPVARGLRLAGPQQSCFCLFVFCCKQNSGWYLFGGLIWICWRESTLCMPGVWPRIC